MLEVFRRKGDAAFREAYVQAQEREADLRNNRDAKKANKKAKRQAKAAKNRTDNQ
jgi:hypothetical protein